MAGAAMCGCGGARTAAAARGGARGRAPRAQRRAAPRAAGVSVADASADAVDRVAQSVCHLGPLPAQPWSARRGTGTVIGEDGLIATAAHVACFRGKDNKMEAIVGKRMFEGVVVGVHSELDVALVRLTHEITKGMPRTPLAECEGGAPPAVELAGEDALLSIPPGTPVRSLGYPAPWTLNLKSSSARAGTRTGEGVLSGVAAVGSANEAAIAEEGGDAAAAVAAGKLHATHVAHNAGVSSGQSGGPVFAEDGAVLGISSVGGGGVEIAVSSNVLSEIVEGEGVESLSMGKWDRRALDMANKVLGVLGLST